MKSIGLKQIIIFFTTIILLHTFANLALAVSGTWSNNGITMYGNHNHNAWIDPMSRKLVGSSSTPSPQPISSIYVDIRLEDRCKNANGTWQSWNQYGFNNKYASSTYTTGTISAQGQYQTCAYGHEYRNRSLHDFDNTFPYLNESHWLQSN